LIPFSVLEALEAMKKRMYRKMFCIRYLKQSLQRKKTRALLKIPDKWKVVAIVTFGYPAEQPKQRKKKPFENMFSFNGF